jgi:hypothetical protein
MSSGSTLASNSDRERPQRRRMLRTWAYICAAGLAVEIAALLVFVVL